MTDAKPTDEDNLALLDALINCWENGVVEFKEAGRDFDTDRIGRYVCALSNEANLGGAPAGWLVFGVRNKIHSVIGTDYRSDPARLNGIKAQVADGTEPSLTFRSVRIVVGLPCGPLRGAARSTGHAYRVEGTLLRTRRRVAEAAHY